MPVKMIFWDKGNVKLIDQTLLPSKFKYISCRDVNSLWHAIKKLQVRGAPAIGIAGALWHSSGIKDSKAKTGDALAKEVKERLSISPRRGRRPSIYSGRRRGWSAR